LDYGIKITLSKQISKELLYPIKLIFILLCADWSAWEFQEESEPDQNSIVLSDDKGTSNDPKTQKAYKHPFFVNYRFTFHLYPPFMDYFCVGIG
jgi:hypothetical protein